MNELIKIESRELAGAAAQTVNARELHAFLEVAKDFSDWIKAQIDRARLVRGRDFETVEVFPLKGEKGGRPRTDYHLTLDAGKHVAMMSGTDKGFEVREYFLECERRSKVPAKPPTELSRMDLIQIAMDAERERLVLADRVAALEPHAVVAIAAPKADALDRISAGTAVRLASLQAPWMSGRRQAAGVARKALTAKFDVPQIDQQLQLERDRRPGSACGQRVLLLVA
jgi:phage anti-repressor protein